MRRLPILLFVIFAAGWVGCSASGEPGKRPGEGGQGGRSGFGGSAANGGNGATGQPDASSSGSGGSDGSTGSDGGPTCSNVCAPGTSDCFGNATRTCAVQGTGCTDWNAPQACSTGTTCQSGTCITGCTNQCTAGLRQCAGIQIQQCVAGSDGCTSWAGAEDCPSGQTCNAGACTTTCANVCTDGATRCAGNGAQSCALQANGCTDWNPSQACPANQACTADRCVPSCTDQCTNGATQCAGSQLQTCAVQGTGCTAWNLPTSCPAQQACQGNQCAPIGGSGGTGGTGGTSGTGGSGGSGGTTSCQPGTTNTQWATSCPSSPVQCTSGTWTAWGSSSPENYPFRFETEHFAFYWPDGRNVTMAQAQAAGQFLESVVWTTYFGNPMYMPEIDCARTDKRKTSVHIIESGLFGGCNNGRPGFWVGPGAMSDHWGLGHEFMHAVQCMTPGFQDCGAGGCWIHESHANFAPHQLPEYRSNVHCSEMLMNMPHLYYGSTRDRYCNWQFFEFLKDKHCYKAVNDMWTATAPSGSRDPWNKLALNMGWNAERLNDEFGEWAMHNITWDYKNPPPTSGTNQSSVYRQNYGQITDTSRPERRRRLTMLESIDAQWATNRRFVSPYYSAPQRWGYNVVRLYPDAGATSVTVTFRGVTQSGANSGWRWGLVATDSAVTTSRYSPLQRGADGQLTFCVNSGESVWLVVVGAPTSIQKIIWDQPYPSIYRYPYMVQLANAWPEGFRNGVLDACPSGTQRHSNGGGCAPSGLSSSVFVGPYARVLGGTVSGTARIEDQAIILNGATVSGGSVGALGILNRFTVSGSARVQTTFYPPGFFESGQGLSGTASLFGDVEYRGQGLNKSSGSFYGFVDNATQSQTINDVTIAPPYAWRP